MNTQAQPQETKEVYFDERGQTLPDAGEETEVPEVEAAAAEPEAAEEAAPEAASSQKQNYRIGDKWFATQEEALAYAQSQVSALETETQVADAYRQGMKDALVSAPQTVPGVTPEVQPEDDLDTEKLYTNPKEFLREFEQKITTKVQSVQEAREADRQQSDQIWREFTERHPELADFRAEAENFVQQNLTTVRAIIGTKGKPASYDYIATKLKSKFEAYANAVRPKRQLPNTGATATPTQRAAGVTPKTAPKKVSTFVEELRSIRKKGR